jgi:hypothetical protein
MITSEYMEAIKEQKEQARKVAEENKRIAENLKDHWKHQNSGAEASWEEN